MAARDDLLAVWEGNDNLLDATGNGYTLTNEGTLYSEDAKLGSHAFDPDGINDGLIQTSSDLDTSERTLAMWLKPNAIGALRFPHQHRTNEATSNGTVLIVNTNGTIRLLIGNGSFFADMTSTATLSTSAYKRVVFRTKAGSHQLIIDNTIEATSSNANSVTYGGDFWLAKSTNAARLYGGKMDGIWLWDKWKSDADLTEHWGEGNGIEFVTAAGVAIFRRRMEDY